MLCYTLGFLDEIVRTVIPRNRSHTVVYVTIILPRYTIPDQDFVIE